MRHAASRSLFDHWNGLCRGRLAPDRNDLDPAAIGAILQDVFILGSDGRNEWKYRVAGTRLSAFAQRELRDESFDKWWRADDRKDVVRMVSGAAQDNTAMISGIAGASSDLADHGFELLLLPLRHGGRPGLRMLGGLFPSPSAASRYGVRIDSLGLVSVRSLTAEAQARHPFGQPPADMMSSLERRRSFRLIDGGQSVI